MLILFLFTTTANAQIITTIAGTGTPGYSGDNGPATAAEVHWPVAVSADKTGNIYVSDPYCYRLRKISKTGIITTIAGTGVSGYNGDDILATNAQITTCGGTVVDTLGNIYIADFDRIRKIDAITGIITTIAGNGIGGYNGENIPATDANINNQDFLAIDAENNIYFTEGSRVRKVNQTTGIITTIAGTGITGYNGDSILATNANLEYPWGIALDTSENIVFCDASNHRIRKIDKLTGIIKTIAGNGTNIYNDDTGLAINAGIPWPIGLCIAKNNDVYFSEPGYNKVKKIDAVSGRIYCIAGIDTGGYTGDGIQATAAELYAPAGIAFDNNGSLIMADQGNNRVRFIKNTLSVTNIENAQGYFFLAPNPAVNNVLIMLTTTTNSPVVFTITNILGIKIQEVQTYSNKQITVNLNSPPGLYLVTATTQNEQYTTKLIIE